MLQKKPTRLSSSLQTQNSKTVEEAKELLLFSNIEDRIIYKCKNILSYSSIIDGKVQIDYYMLDLKNKNEINDYSIMLHIDGIALYYKSENNFGTRLLDFTVGENNG